MHSRFAILQPRAAVTLDDYVRDLAWAPEGRALAVAGGEGGVYLVSVAGDALDVRRLGEHLPGALAVAWAPQGPRFATSGQDGAVALWDASSGAEFKRWQPARAWSEQLAWSADGQLLASAAGRVVSLWTPSGERAFELADHPASVAGLGWGPGSQELAAACNGGVWVHRIRAEVSTRDYPAAGACLTVAFSPNGKLLATGMQAGAVHFWYLATGRNSAMRGYPTRVPLTGWSANSRYLATGSGNAIVVWDFAGKGPEGSQPMQLTGHTDRVDALAWQPGGPHLASGGRDWRLSLWLPGKAAQAIDAHLAAGEITALRWSPDGRTLAVGAAQGELALYELEPTSR